MSIDSVFTEAGWSWCGNLSVAWKHVLQPNGWNSMLNALLVKFKENMFIKPTCMERQRGYTMQGCSVCRLKCITLLLMSSHPEELQHTEHTLLICERVTTNFLMDLYVLYTGKDTKEPRKGPEYVQSITPLIVDTLIPPEEWLYCILWSNYYRVKEHETLELFIGRPQSSGFYYAVGPEGTLLVNKTNHTEMIQISRDTVQVLTGISNTVCCQPTIKIVNKGYHSQRV